MHDRDQVLNEVDALETSLPGIVDDPPSYDEVMASNPRSNNLPKVE